MGVSYGGLEGYKFRERQFRKDLARMRGGCTSWPAPAVIAPVQTPSAEITLMSSIYLPVFSLFNPGSHSIE